MIERDMRDLWLYDRLSRFSFMNYRAKILVMAFVGTHIPLIALASYFAFQSAPNWHTFAVTVGITLAATLVGTAVILFVLNELLRPVVKTSRALRAYRDHRAPSNLPIGYADEVGTLMADAGSTITHLEAVRDVLEHIDAATGLMNRKRLLSDLEGRASRGATFSLGVVRFANLSRVTEAFDAAAADKAMKLVAARIAATLPERADLARVGAADLAVVFADTGSERAGRTLDTVRAACGADIALDGLDLKPDLLCGVSAFPGDASSVDGLLDNAVAAASMASNAMPTFFHSPEARTRSLERLRLEQELRHALDRKQFRLHYQPVVDLAAGRVVGAEALIRWQHPEQGMLPPAAFVPAAEACGLIDPMGLWVMGEACAQARAWNDAGRTGLKVAVNLSARQFLDADLGNHVSAAIETARIEPGQLEIELTETAAMADHDHTRRVFTMLRDLGVSIAIDDFGTGYAGMSWLRRLPFDKLKIDREFVSNVHGKRDAQAICGALVTLSRGLGLHVLAEGTETQEEVGYLASLGCDLFQGYFFAKPMAADDFGMAVDALALKHLMQRMKPASRSAETASAEAETA